MSFQDIIKNDLAVFINPTEFGEMCDVVIEGVEYHIPGVIDTDAVNVFVRSYDGVYQTDRVLVIRESDIDRAPVRGQMIGLNGKDYIASQCRRDIGMLIITLEIPDV